MVSFEQNNPHSIPKLGDQEKFELNSVKRLPNSVLFTHEIWELLLCVYIIQLDHDFSFFIVPFLFCHFLEPVLSKHLNYFWTAFMDSLWLLENVIAHPLELEFIGELAP